MSIRVLHSGLLTTIQDIGRYGSQKFGVIVSGAMDSYSLRLANLLVGNKENEATLEITLFGTTLQFVVSGPAGADPDAVIASIQSHLPSGYVVRTVSRTD